MSNRPITSDLLLVGSLPTDSTEAAFRSGAEFFGDLTFALPDGETGMRAGWVGYEVMNLLHPHPDLVIVEDLEPGNRAPRHFYESAVWAVREGVTEIRWDKWPRIDDALESWSKFKALRDEGVIPSETRFQVSLPFPISVLGGAFREDFNKEFEIVGPAYEDMVARELKRLFDTIPAKDLALQWDVCVEVLDVEGVVPWMDKEGWERFAGPVRRLTPLVPEDVLLGYHLCYGTFPEWPMYEARDYEQLVKMANYAVENSGRTVDWFHMAGPKHLRSEDDAFFEPLKDLNIGDARVFLGIVLPIDGVRGFQHRYATAKKYLDDFGVAMYCGFGRQPGVDGQETMREHRETVMSIAGTPA